MAWLAQAAWGGLQKNMSQLHVRSYEMGILLVPSLEARYRRGLRGGPPFSCTLPSTPLPPRVPPPDTDSEAVVFCAWNQHGVERGGASTQERGASLVPVPVPYKLPPVRYAEMDLPWCVDVRWGDVAYWQQRDIYGDTFEESRGRFRMYGMEDPAE